MNIQETKEKIIESLDDRIPCDWCFGKIEEGEPITKGLFQIFHKKCLREINIVKGRYKK